MPKTTFPKTYQLKTSHMYPNNLVNYHNGSIGSMSTSTQKAHHQSKVCVCLYCHSQLENKVKILPTAATLANMCAQAGSQARPKSKSEGIKPFIGSRGDSKQWRWSDQLLKLNYKLSTGADPVKDMGVHMYTQ